MDGYPFRKAGFHSQHPLAQVVQTRLNWFFLQLSFVSYLESISNESRGLYFGNNCAAPQLVLNVYDCLATWNGCFPLSRGWTVLRFPYFQTFSLDG